MSTTPARIAIIGAGPRALGAIEALARSTARPRIVLLDPCPHPGAGPNFAPDQSPLGLLNIPVRAVDLPPLPGMPDFASWLGPHDPDDYPARSELGGYFRDRLDLLIRQGPLKISVVARAVASITPEGQGWRVDGAAFDAVLLAPGQPVTAPDRQLSRWQDHAARTGAVLCPAYPMNKLQRAAQDWVGSRVAIRGMGLSTLDVLRLLTEGQGGHHDRGRYVASGAEPARILPFSLNGLPPFPKPASAALDAALDPTPSETAAFEAALARALTLPPQAALGAMCAPLADAAVRMLGHRPDDWLAAECAASGSQHGAEPVTLLRDAIAMARGDAAPDAGYVIGALWRKWQNELRRGFNPAPLPDRTAEALIGFDEGLKRYSYGPPLASAERLLSLIEAGLVDLRATDDPDILLSDVGWVLQEGKSRAEVSVMVDAVLPSPTLEALDDPLISGLMRQGLIVPAGPGMGARVTPDGCLIRRDGRPTRGLAALGRIALGGVIAVDSIHDCFGAAASRWAEGVARDQDA